MAIAKFSVPEKLAQAQASFLEKVKKKGKIRIGVNEVTKAIERGQAKLVVIAEDVSPEEIVMHLPLICDEKQIPYSFVKTKKELGEKSGIGVGTAAIAVTNEGEAKKELAEIAKQLSNLRK
ncbi:MAG: 50S ribosomal protein L7ae [Candidatus Diapherotrites archaeon]|nr:50S ribosomal protein L7ae [Candidatus Diapherotrites archaeon]